MDIKFSSLKNEAKQTINCLKNGTYAVFQVSLKYEKRKLKILTSGLADE